MVGVRVVEGEKEKDHVGGLGCLNTAENGVSPESTRGVAARRRMARQEIWKTSEQGSRRVEFRGTVESEPEILSGMQGISFAVT